MHVAGKLANQGNLEAQGFLRLLAQFPLNILNQQNRISEIICDGDPSVNSRIPRQFPSISLTNCIGHKATKIGRKWKSMCDQKREISKGKHRNK
jgi:hypothetical protein